MIRFAVFSPETGRIMGVFVMAADEMSANIPEGYLAREVEDEIDPSRYYIDVENDDALVEMPPAPSERHVWDYAAKEWVDPRTETDKQGEFKALRAATWLTKAEFLQACMALGLLTPAEAATAARGDIPEPFLPAVASMTPEEQDMLPVIWPAVTRINRMDPLILSLAKGARVSEETLDDLFGLTPYRP